jgi:hypothetical protein
MKRNKSVLKITCFYCAAVLPLAALGQADQNQLAKCYAIENISEKVACYDKLARPAQDASAVVSKTEPAITVKPAVTATSAEPGVTAEATVAVRAEPASTSENSSPQAKNEASIDEQEELVSTVMAINNREPHKLQITLANGQVWKQSIAKYFWIEENDTVRITQSRWGKSFRLTRDGKPGFIQVLRLR